MPSKRLNPEKLTCEDIVSLLRSFSDPAIIAGMPRYGIVTDRALGVSTSHINEIAGRIGTDHTLALELWDTGIHEARLIAPIIDDPALVTGEQMDRWSADFYSWDMCDQCCLKLFHRTSLAYEKCFEWSRDEREFVKRTAFALIASLALHDKKAPDGKFRQFFPVIVRESVDGRNMVKKAANWALRQIGKRNTTLNKEAIAVSREMLGSDLSSARWIARDALKELEGEAVQQRLEKWALKKS
ncbi:DNA alkylation repair protein [Methanocella sp. MCL-LM]|uniref:DNA alkylation repair protein n=1 Tax=Methanocella sp. MCL-LM TaxID=3412035 RepID=UPI003C778C8D